MGGIEVKRGDGQKELYGIERDKIYNIM